MAVFVHSCALRVVLPLIGQRCAQPLLRRKIRKAKPLLLADSQSDSGCVVLRVVRRERNIETSCSARWTGQLLAHRAAPFFSFADAECTYDDLAAGDFIGLDHTLFDATSRCVASIPLLATHCTLLTTCAVRVPQEGTVRWRTSCTSMAAGMAWADRSRWACKLRSSLLPRSRAKGGMAARLCSLCAVVWSSAADVSCARPVYLSC